MGCEGKGFGGVFGGVFLEWFGMGRGVTWREEMMGIIFSWERWECWSWGIRKTNQERRTMDGVGRGGVGVESWKFKSSRNF